jgi:hypothetical protein
VQHDAEHSFSNESTGVPIGSGNAKVVNDNGLTKTIEVSPLQVGQLNLDIVVLFADAGMAHKSYQLNVIPSSKGVKHFYLNRGSHSMAIVLEDKDEDRQVRLTPEVYYDQLDYPIYLEDSTQISFTVDRTDFDPVIRVDANGMVHGLRPGKATITADFDGVKDSVTVTVYTKEDAPAGYRRIQ